LRHKIDPKWGLNIAPPLKTARDGITTHFIESSDKARFLALIERLNLEFQKNQKNTEAEN
jgi:hypothetical protein